MIDPHRPVDRAIITHGHADHARPGNNRVLTTAPRAKIMASRFGARKIGAVQTVQYEERTSIGEVSVTLVPAGHILGSAQVVVEQNGARVMVSGDYKRRLDPTCESFQVVTCDLANTLVKAEMRTVQTIGIPANSLDLDDVDAFVIALKSRSIPVSEAIARSLKACKWLEARSVKQTFFKYCSTFDSTDEGNIGPVADALLDASGGTFTIFRPAFPENGRI